MLWLAQSSAARSMAALFLSFVLFACASQDFESAELPPLWSGPSESIEVLAGAGKVGGLDAGDLDGRPGDEIVAVAGDGRVWIIRLTTAGWKSAVVDTLPGEAIGVAVLPRKSGISGFVTVGKQSGDEDSPGPGVAYLFTRPLSFVGGVTEGWQRKELLVDGSLLHGVAADEDGIALAGYSKTLHLFSPGPDGLQHQVLGTLPGDAKGVAMDKQGIAVACASGELVHFQRPQAGVESTWKQRTLWRFPDALARVDSYGGRIAVSSNDGGLYCYEPGLAGDILFFQGTDRLRGAVFLQGPKLGLGTPWYLATAGYDGRVSALPNLGSKLGPVHLDVDQDRLHHLAGARLALQPGEQLTPALVTCGYSGRVVVVPFVR